VCVAFEDVFEFSNLISREWIMPQNPSTDFISSSE
jgi:hypothetical protein